MNSYFIFLPFFHLFSYNNTTGDLDDDDDDDDEYINCDIALLYTP